MGILSHNSKQGRGGIQPDKRDSRPGSRDSPSNSASASWQHNSRPRDLGSRKASTDNSKKRSRNHRSSRSLKG
jgi:hypothetical protein